uniref:DUF2723 domain-containing protein n=1 Tax=Guillardia theta TaxID=55529 RepID=A0A7S4JJE5_GUITH
MYPTVPGGDSGELIVAGCTAGLAHPPGYPLFTMLAILFHNIPFGSPAWRVNLLSVFLSTGCAWFQFHSVVLWEESLSKDRGGKGGRRMWEWTVSVWAGVLTSLLMAFCPLLWMYSIQAEVFAMNNFFVSLFLYLTVRFYIFRETRIAFLGSLAIGLGLSNQHSLIFYALPLVLFVFITGFSVLCSPKNLLILVASGLVGLSPYVYLPLAGRQAAFGAWGELDTVDGFLTHFLRKEYGTFRLYSGNENSKIGEQLWEALFLYVKNFTFESTLVIGPFFFAVGLSRVVVDCFSSRRLNTAGFAFTCSFIFYMVVFHCLSNLPLDQPLYFGVHMRFWMQGHIIAFMLLGVGAAKIWRFVGSMRNVAAAITTIALCGLQVGLHYRAMDQSQNRFVYRYGLMHIENLPKNAILIVKGDVITNSIRYLQRCEGFRPDVQHLDQSMMTYEWFVKKQARHFRHIKFPNEVYNPYKPNGYSMATFLQKNAMNPKYPAFLCGGWYHDEIPAEMGGGIPGFRTWNVGPCERIRPASEVVSVSTWIKEAANMTPNFEPPPEDKYPEGTWEYVTNVDYWAAKHKIPYSLLMWAIENKDNSDALVESKRMYDELLKIHPKPPDFLYKNAGIVYGRLREPGNHCKMIKCFSLFLLNTLEVPSQTKDILKIIKDYVNFDKQMKQSKAKSDCEEDVASVARRAYMFYKGKNPKKKKAKDLNSASL